MNLTVEIDEPRCVGAGHCVAAAPDVFDQRDDDGIVILLDAHPPATETAGVREAAVLCPAAAILLHERGGQP